MLGLPVNAVASWRSAGRHGGCCVQDTDRSITVFGFISAISFLFIQSFHLNLGILRLCREFFLATVLHI